MNEKILIVDDEKNITDVLSYALKKEEYIVEKAYDGQEAINKIESFKPQVVLLDLMLPVLNGYDVCRRIQNKNIGIIMLTAKNDIVDKILGLELGADDYLTKPFDVREVSARVKSLIRRINNNTEESTKEEDSIVINNFKIDKEKRIVSINDEIIEFTAIEFDLLYYLLLNKNRVYSRNQLLDIIWGIEYVGTTRTVDTHIQRIRKKLGQDYENLIQTVHGVGYKGADLKFENGN